MQSIEVVDYDDPILIWLDGELVGKIEEADSIEGFILQWQISTEGNWNLIKRTGKVRITIRGIEVARLNSLALEN